MPPNPKNIRLHTVQDISFLSKLNANFEKYILFKMNIDAILQSANNYPECFIYRVVFS